MQRRRFLQTLGAASPMDLATQAVFFAETSSDPHGEDSAEPQVLFYDDGRHAAPIYQYAAPLNPDDSLATVD